MKRIFVVLTVGAIMALMMALAGPVFAGPHNCGKSNSVESRCYAELYEGQNPNYGTCRALTVTGRGVQLSTAPAQDNPSLSPDTFSVLCSTSKGLPPPPP